ncbi:hypothetical protein BGX38DRAFT_615525 [Terfezia claveryi]|nr:hypothetical protein BGX38DRAFT_615525 [Terfezia claveryi]
MQANHPSLEIDNDLVPIVCSYKCNQLSGNRNKADIGPRTRIQELQLCLNPTLTPEQANEPCINYTPITLLTKLNALTGYELLMEERNLGEGLAQFISGPHDFGIAYAWFRTAFSFIQLPPETLYDMHRTFIVHYAGLPTLQNCDRSLTTANFSNPGALYQEPQIQTAVDGSGETIIRLARWNARRFWDVVANRVVPSEWHTRRTRGVTQLTSSSFIPQSLANSLRDSLGLGYVAISHSWASDLQMKISPVNAQQWPIPLPAGVTLETIRDELLSLHGKRIQQTTRFIPTQYRFDYCWLDILCLRQAWYDNAGRLLTWVPGLTQQNYKAQERKRLFEWKTDVPTIGGIYRQANQVYVYLNGIGKPCSGDEKVWRDSNHWTRRAWTLQEWVVSPAGLKPLLMGVSGEVLNSREIDGALQQALVERLTIARALPDINSTIQDSSSCRDLIGRISQRSCSNEVDKIAGLLHFFSEKALPALPVYKPYETAEEAWYRLINALANPWRFALSMALWQQVERQGQLYPSWDAVLHIPERGDSYAESHSMNFGNTLLTRGGPALVAPVALPCWISTFTQVSTDQWTPAELQETQKAPDKYDLRVNFTPSLVEKHYLVPQICLNIQSMLGKKSIS